jgi:hypothetical protein
MISKSVLAPPGGSIAGSTAWKRRSALVNVPAFSRNAEAGRMTSAYLVVSFSKISWQTTNSRLSSAATTCVVSGSVWATSSPKMYIAFRSPAIAASNICGIVYPFWRESGTPHACSKERATSSSATER